MQLNYTSPSHYTYIDRIFPASITPKSHVSEPSTTEPSAANRTPPFVYSEQHIACTLHAGLCKSSVLQCLRTNRAEIQKHSFDTATITPRNRATETQQWQQPRKSLRLHLLPPLFCACAVASAAQM